MKKSQLRNIIRESIKELINEQTGLTCYTCINGTIYSTNAFTSTTGPYGSQAPNVNVCDQVPLATGISYTSFTGTYNIGTTVGNDLVFFDSSSNPYFTAMGCTFPTSPGPTDPTGDPSIVDPCDKTAWKNHATSEYPQLIGDPIWAMHFCEYCTDGTIPPGTDSYCKCCDKNLKK